MGATTPFRRTFSPIIAAISVLYAVIGVGILPGFAAQISLPVTLMVSQTTTGGLCRDSSKVGVFGSEIVVMCTTGRTVGSSGRSTNLPESPVQDGMYRYVTLGTGAGESLGTLKSYTAAGTVTSWRVINLAKRDYIEMTVSW